MPWSDILILCLAGLLLLAPLGVSLARHVAGRAGRRAGRRLERQRAIHRLEAQLGFEETSDFWQDDGRHTVWM